MSDPSSPSPVTAPRDPSPHLPLEAQNALMRTAIEGMPHGLAVFDTQRQLVISNRNFAAIYGLSADDVTSGATIETILDRRRDKGTAPAGGAEEFIKRRLAIVAEGQARSDKVELADGRIILVSHQPLPDGGWLSTHQDITETLRSEAEILQLARHDPLTGLPNRLLFQEELARAQGRVDGGEALAVLWVDVDYFKSVNDKHGHAAGDAVLAEAARRIRSALRQSDFAARIGGDEFAVIAARLTDPRRAGVIAQRIIRNLGKPFVVNGQSIFVGASVGIAVSPGDSIDMDQLLHFADLALYRAKNGGRGSYHYYETAMDEAQQRRRKIEQGLRRALDDGSVRLAFQPMFDLGAQKISGLEALIRWNHHELGPVSPAEFIPIADETGLILPIGGWVLDEACRQASRWPEHIRLAVNLSPVQFRDPELVSTVLAALRRHGVTAGRLELEVTERVFTDEPQSTLATLQALREHGIRIAIDDFGTSHPALQYMRDFPFASIKIDRSLIAELGQSPKSAAMLRALVALGQSFGMDVAAEGVETEQQLLAAEAQGCAHAQGFLFSPALPATAAADLAGLANPRPNARSLRRAR